MNKLLTLLIYYKKLVIPILVVSILIAFIFIPVIGAFELNIMALAYIFASPLLQYFIYDVSNPDEYYFYYNLGHSKLSLWLSVNIMSLFIGISIIIIDVCFM